MHETAGIPATSTTSDHLGIELINQSSHWQSGTIAVCFIEADTQVFAHPLNGETKLKFATVHRAGTIVHLPAGCRTFPDDFYQLVDIKASALREIDTFSKALHDSGDTDLIDHLAN